MTRRIPKIRVCHVATADLWAGAEVQLAVLLRSLAALTDLELSAILFNDGRLAQELRDAGVRTHVISETERNSLSILRELDDYFRRNTIDVLHSHKYKDNILGALASIRRRVPHRVRTVHGAPEPFSGLQAVKMNAYAFLDGLVNRRAVDRLLAVSVALRDYLSEEFGADKITTIHNGVDVARIRVTTDLANTRKELGVDRHEFIIGTMGRLHPVKGVEVFLRAARVIKDRGRKARFVVAGDGPLREQLQTLAQQYGLAHEAMFLGHRNDSNNILGLMDLFVLPSLSEGIPLVLLEALALARPVVATAVGGIPEVIEHEISGLLVDAGNHDDLAKQCLRVMNDPVLAQGFGHAGRKRVEEAFSADIMAANVANVYRSLMYGASES